MLLRWPSIIWVSGVNAWVGADGVIYELTFHLLNTFCGVVRWWINKLYYFKIIFTSTWIWLLMTVFLLTKVKDFFFQLPGLGCTEVSWNVRQHSDNINVYWLIHRSENNHGCCHIACWAFWARTLLKVTLEPQFNQLRSGLRQIQFRTSSN